MEEKVILVDEQDNPIGLMEKLEAHQKALLHRAFSVFILNDKGIGGPRGFVAEGVVVVADAGIQR